MQNEYLEQYEVVTKVKASLTPLTADIARRNDYINTRLRYIYDEGLFEGLDLPADHDKTEYNWCKRITDIQTSQFMGRGFNMYSSYNKQDPDVLGPDGTIDTKQQTVIDSTNKVLKGFADLRQKAIRGILADNGGMTMFKRGARIGSESGFTVFKGWFDATEKKYKISTLENVTNYWAGFAGDDFTKRDFDSYVYQISEDSAYANYGDKLKDGETFATTTIGSPLAGGKTSDPINTLNGGDNQQDKQLRQMVSVIEYTGKLSGCSFDKNGNYSEIARGKENQVNILIVGDHIVQTITDEKYMPDYWMAPNRERTNWPWGESDLVDSALSINKTYVEVRSTAVTLFHKEVYNTYMAKGFTAGNIPKRKKRSVTMIPMSQEQSIEPLQSTNNYIAASAQEENKLKEDFVRITGVGAVLFDDPTVSLNSNQALMTTLKGVIDIVDGKQTIWESMLIDIFTTALKKSALFISELKDAVNDPGWFLYVEWPNVMRKDDATYQAMQLNLWNTGVISYETYLQRIGIVDTTEEIDRAKDDMNDPVRAAIRSHSLGTLAMHTINKAAGIPAWGFNPPHVTVRGEMTPNQEANLATQQGWQTGPYPPSAGPQGNQGDAANQNLENEGFINGNPFDGGMPVQAGPPGQQQPGSPASPVSTPDMNTATPVSQPGSGAAPTSPAGAVATANQNAGH